MSSDRKINIPFSAGGIDINSENNIKKAKYIENLILGSSGKQRIHFLFLYQVS